MRQFGKSIKSLFDLIQTALDGKTGMYATPKGNIAIIKWEEYERLKHLDTIQPSK